MRIELKDGTKKFLDGEQGSERLVRVELADGHTRYFDGAKGKERCVRAEFPDGQRQFYVRRWTFEPYSSRPRAVLPDPRFGLGGRRTACDAYTLLLLRCC